METTHPIIETGYNYKHVVKKFPFMIRATIKFYWLTARVFPNWTARRLMNLFRKPRKAVIKARHLAIMEKAEQSSMRFKGHKIATFKWGNGATRVFLAHGWNSKSADFHHYITALLATEAFTIHAIDMNAHGNSGGRYSAAPDFKNLIVKYEKDHGPFEAYLGYSLGGLSASKAVTQLPNHRRPKSLVLVSAPPYPHYFFREFALMVTGLESINKELFGLMKEYYGETPDDYNLLEMAEEFDGINKRLFYDRADASVSFERGQELKASWPSAKFVETRDLGHYLILKDERVVKAVVEALLEDTARPQPVSRKSPHSLN